MSVDLKDLETTPTLSLDPFGEAEKEPEVPAAPAPEAVKPAFVESILNDDERKMVDSFAKQIDLTNNNMILQYGAEHRRKWLIFPRRLWKTSGRRISARWAICFPAW